MTLDRREARAAGHDRHPRGRPAAAAALELGLGGDRKVKASMGAVVRRRAREARAHDDRGAADRARALLELQRHGVPPSADLLRALMTDATPKSAPQRSTSPASRRATAPRPSPPQHSRMRTRSCKRRAAEALVRQGLTPSSRASRRCRHLRAAAEIRIASSATPAGSRSSTRRAPSGAARHERDRTSSR